MRECEACRCEASDDRCRDYSQMFFSSFSPERRDVFLCNLCASTELGTEKVKPTDTDKETLKVLRAISIASNEIIMRANPPEQPRIAEQRIEEALKVAQRYGKIDGNRHKMWTIDQMVRTLAGNRYEEWVESCTYVWDEGIEP